MAAGEKKESLLKWVSSRRLFRVAQTHWLNSIPPLFLREGVGWGGGKDNVSPAHPSSYPTPPKRE